MFEYMYYVYVVCLCIHVSNWRVTRNKNVSLPVWKQRRRLRMTNAKESMVGQECTYIETYSYLRTYIKTYIYKDIQTYTHTYIYTHIYHTVANYRILRYVSMETQVLYVLLVPQAAASTG